MKRVHICKRSPPYFAGIEWLSAFGELVESLTARAIRHRMTGSILVFEARATSKFDFGPLVEQARKLAPFEVKWWAHDEREEAR